MIRFLIEKLVGLRRRADTAAARLFVSRSAPELARAFDAFASRHQSGSRRQPFKGYDLWRILDRVRPTSIVELGSGTTSAVFALWTRRHEASYVSYEHDANWARVTEDCLREAGLPPSVKHVAARARADSRATGFVDALPEGVDFVYVDGPPCLLPGGAKVPNDDVTRHLESGGRPRAIVVDGRVETVDWIRSHPEGGKYEFAPSLVYCLRRRLWGRALAGREHTLFIRGRG